MPSPPLSEIEVAGGDGPGALPDGDGQPLAREASPTDSGSAPEAPGAVQAGVVSPELRASLWWGARALYRSRWWGVATFLLVSVAAVWGTLQLPNRYAAETRVLLPEGGDAFGGILETIAPGASAILGEAGGGYTRYLAILTSRTTMEAVVDRFELVEVYELEESQTPRADALKELADNTRLDVSLEFDYLAVSVLDTDRARSAAMANYYIELLNDRNIELSVSSAAGQRRFLERRLDQAQLALDSAQQELQAFQERNGVLALESQAEALMTSIGTARGRVAEAEVLYETLRSQYGDENPDVRAARAAVDEARAQLSSLTNGGEAVLPVPITRFPAVGREYAQIFQEIETQTAILSALRPLYEQAVLSEQKDTDAVQVLDPAVPPAKKAEPRRSILVLSLVAAGMLLWAFLVLARAWYRARGRAALHRLRAA